MLDFRLVISVGSPNNSVITENSSNIDADFSILAENVIGQKDYVTGQAMIIDNITPAERTKRKAGMDDDDIQDKRSKQEEDQIHGTTFNVSTSNSFQELGNTKNQTDDNGVSSDYPPLKMSQRREKKVTSKEKNNTNTNKSKAVFTNPTNLTNTSKTKSPHKLPSIVVFNIDTKSLIDALAIVLENSVFKVQIVNANRSHILTSSVIDHKKVLEFLKHKNANNFSYTPKESKPFNYIVKGIDLAFDNEDVRIDIMKQCPNVNILKVNNLMSQKSKELTNIRIVQITPESDLKSVLNVKYLLHQVVKWSRLRTSYTQCRNCQRPGHAASNCNMKYRCMKCPMDHEPGKCPRTEELKKALDSNDADQIIKVKEEVSCVNCGEKGHPANYKKCKVYRAYIDKIELFGVDLLQLSDQINAFMPMYRGASSAQEKKIMLISFLFQLHSQCP